LRLAEEIGAQLLACHLSLRGLFDGHASLSRDGFSIQPLAHAALTHADLFGERGLRQFGMFQVGGESHGR